MPPDRRAPPEKNPPRAAAAARRAVAVRKPAAGARAAGKSRGRVTASPAARETGGSSLERMLAVLDLFDPAHGVRSVDDISAASSYTRSTAYRYVRELATAGLLTQVAPGQYSLGPRILEFDRQLRESDPLLARMRTIEPTLPRWSPEQLWLLCRVYRDKVICIHQAGRLTQAVSFTRGFPMPLFRGATSKAILAFLHERQYTKLYLDNPDQVRAGNLGTDWAEFKAKLRAIRQVGYSISEGEVDRGVFGIAAPVFGAGRKVLGSISVVRPASVIDRKRLDRECREVVAIAARLSLSPPKD